MALMTSYLIKASNAEDFLNALRNAKAPERFTNSFLTDLDFTSSNDRLYIGVLKGLRFLDDNGAPTQRYFAFLDQSQSGHVLADAIRDAYEDLFAVNREAHKLSLEDLEGKLKTLTRGQKSDNVIGWMANTFRVLCDLADWSPLAPPLTETLPPVVPTPETHPQLENKTVLTPPLSPARSGTDPKPLELHYNIQLILPDSRDPAVYEVLFASLRKHLL
jgi:Family of unknown function (DUF5343)